MALVRLGTEVHRRDEPRRVPYGGILLTARLRPPRRGPELRRCPATPSRLVLNFAAIGVLGTWIMIMVCPLLFWRKLPGRQPTRPGFRLPGLALDQDRDHRLPRVGPGPHVARRRAPAGPRAVSPADRRRALVAGGIWYAGRVAAILPRLVEDRRWSPAPGTHVTGRSGSDVSSSLAEAPVIREPLHAPRRPPGARRGGRGHPLRIRGRPRRRRERAAAASAISRRPATRVRRSSRSRRWP